MSNLVNLGFFQCTWLATVFGAAHGLLWPGALALCCSFAAQSARRIPVRLPGYGVLVAAAVIGFAADSGLVLLEAIEFPQHTRYGWAPPAWMSVLWINFATTLDESLAWAGDRRFVAAAAGAVGGPLAYLAGQAAEAVRLSPGPQAMIATALLWSIAFPAMAALAKSLRGQDKPSPASTPDWRAG